jgi:hypothetical protein
VDERHQPLLAHLGRVGVLVAHRQDAAALPVGDRVEDHVGEIIVADINQARIDELLAPDRAALQRLIRKQD